MRAFILVTALATATIHIVHAMPSSNLAVRSAFPDAAGIPHISHPSHQHNRLYQGKKVGEGEQRMVLSHAAPGSVHLAEPREDKKARNEKKTRRGVLRERTIKNADYGSGSAPAGEAVAHSQAEPAPSPTNTPAAAPGPARISDDAEPPQAAHA
ncbi:hypothetical protein BDR03DRAFT_1008714 [Suillus americanus]|nr:hypothetical protein BDR03DRAFT_1008714 [Suillus americanus]